VTKIYDLATKIFPLVASWLPNKQLIRALHHPYNFEGNLYIGPLSPALTFESEPEFFTLFQAGLSVALIFCTYEQCLMMARGYIHDDDVPVSTSTSPS